MPLVKFTDVDTSLIAIEATQIESLYLDTTAKKNIVNIRCFNKDTIYGVQLSDDSAMALRQFNSYVNEINVAKREHFASMHRYSA